MDKKTQDLNWKCLSKDAREDVKESYRYNCSDKAYNAGVNETLEAIFGHHNLTSDTEPEDMLMVERQRVQNMYDYNDDILLTDPTHKGAKLLAAKLKELFGDKCLPDDEKQNSPKHSNSFQIGKNEQPSVQVEPKFHKGDKVKIADEKVSTFGNIATITHCEVDEGKVFYWLNDDIGYYSEHQLEPYTEPETKEDAPRPHKYSVGQKVLNHYCKSEILTIGGLAGHSDKNNPMYRVLDYPYLWNECELDPYTEPKSRNISQEIAICDKPEDNQLKDNMEEKELNLAELLKGCEGEEFYSLMHGNARFKTIDADGFVVFDLPEDISVYDNGKYDLNAEVIIFPSRTLYEKYPLNAKKAWREWQENRKPKRWRAKEGGIFYRIEIDGQVFPRTESFTFGDNKLFEQFNYFRTENEAQQAAEAVRKCLRKFHEKNCKQ